MRHAKPQNLVKSMETRSLVLTLAVASVLSAAGVASAQEAAAPDTSEWTCSKCPFDRGYRSDVELGGAYVDDASREVRRLHRPRRGRRVRPRQRRGRCRDGVRLRPELRADRPRPRLARGAPRRRPAGPLRVRTVLRCDPAQHLGHDRDPIQRQRHQLADAAGQLGRRRQHGRHDRAERQPAPGGRGFRPRPLRRRRPASGSATT